MYRVTCADLHRTRAPVGRGIEPGNSVGVGWAGAIVTTLTGLGDVNIFRLYGGTQDHHDNAYPTH
jgi:hypothetical protein